MGHNNAYFHVPDAIDGVSKPLLTTEEPEGFVKSLYRPIDNRPIICFYFALSGQCY
jgi:hypothetical protein